MYAIVEGLRQINDENVHTFIRTIEERNTQICVEAGTTGYKGTPCRKSGGRTFIKFECKFGDFLFEPVFDDDGDVSGIEIATCGDAGLNAIMKALDFVKTAINDQRFRVDD